MSKLVEHMQERDKSILWITRYITASIQMRKNMKKSFKNSIKKDIKLLIDIDKFS
ncbi:MAG: hypothetical protein ACPKPY_11600 [Nitrososphaeraceae archaeon]